MGSESVATGVSASGDDPTRSEAGHHSPSSARPSLNRGHEGAAARHLARPAATRSPDIPNIRRCRVRPTPRFTFRLPRPSFDPNAFNRLTPLADRGGLSRHRFRDEPAARDLVEVLGHRDPWDRCVNRCCTRRQRRCGRPSSPSRPPSHGHQKLALKTRRRAECRSGNARDGGSGAPPAASRPRPRSFRPSTAPRHRRAHRRPRSRRGAPWSRRTARL